jgi:hypothetical protein
MSWLSDKIADLRDTATDMVHSVTEPFVWCTSTNGDGKRCTLDKHTSGSHEDGQGGTW